VSSNFQHDLILSQENKLALLYGTTRKDILLEETLSEIFKTTVINYPYNIALIDGERVYTYHDINELSHTIACNLNALKIGKGDVIGLYLPRGAELLITQLSVTKSGATWLPFDIDTPHDRISICLRDSKASGILSLKSYGNKLSDIPTKNLFFEDLQVKNNSKLKNDTLPEDIAYIIYTSGSTGTPKGISISHKNICHFLRSENSILGITSTDKVYQGFSCAFDMSFEEIWISYLAGAALWIAPKETVNDPEAIAKCINKEHITVLHAVPSLLALISDTLNPLRIINVGGEACPESLANRLLLIHPNLKLYNTYGPTETTVSATLSELKLNKPLTIGTPLPNYGIVILNSLNQIAAIDEEGEIGILGPGLSPGYLNNIKLNAEKFIPLIDSRISKGAKVYLTGDLGKIDASKNVHCLGRIDNQVKLRGFRIELDEITSVLLAYSNIKNAVTVLRPFGVSDELVAYIVSGDSSLIDRKHLKDELAKRLPKYMVPVHIEQLTKLPRLVSGKIDINALKVIDLAHLKYGNIETAEPTSVEESILFDIIKQLIPGSHPTSDADFFDDLGGHSLLVARMISQIRKDKRYISLGISIIYQKRKLGLIAEAMQTLAATHTAYSNPIRLKVNRSGRFICGIAQALILPLFITLNISDWLAPFFIYHYFTGDEGDSIAKAIGLSLLTFVICRLLNFVIAILGKRYLTRPLRKGRYPLWGITYFNWWLATRFAELPDLYLLTSTFWIRVYLRALGAKIGKDAIIDTVTFAAPELTRIGANASIGNFTNFENVRVENSELIVGSIEIEDDATVESYCVIEENTYIKTGAILEGLSCLSANQTIHEYEIWSGTPARKSDRINSLARKRLSTSKYKSTIIASVLALSAIFASVLLFIPTFPAFLIIDWVDTLWLDIFSSNYGPVITFIYIFLIALPASALFITLTILLTAAIKRLIPKAAPQTFHIDSVKFVRKKFINQILDSSLRELHGLYASVFVAPWLRLLGAKIGTNSEISNAEGFIPDLLEIGNDCFVADGASLGEEEQSCGWITQSKTIINDRSFIGNSAYVAGGTMIPSDVLIGVQTRAPLSQSLKNCQTWLGSPALLLPSREGSPTYAPELTFRPSKLRYIARASIELLRILVPISFAIASGYSVVKLLLPITIKYGLGIRFIAALSLAGCCYAVASFTLVLCIKWLSIGRYKTKTAPMWTTFVWLSEAVTSVYESLAVPNLLNLLRGTPLLPFFLRLLGVKIGKNVFLNTTDFTEFDCVKIGDRSELNNWSGPQTHLFEDRIMKIGKVNIGNDVCVGPRSIILYDTYIENNVTLGSLSLVSKGENLPTGTRWAGSPAVTVN